ncbi:Fasciclin-domain-containing protein [Schizopora paradoxa]|uniref:Fasciclin-domain-containing protein n=1 Tax=Schizopora paradoxa TaxID=27342 RepID=A0A0H2S1I1_9AGAM|nr:Fasciclin-domain-containing protein [Schizopora paradoxa]
MHSASSLSLALMLAVGASAQNYSYLSSLNQQLTTMGLYSLVDAINSIQSTNAGQRLFSQLDNTEQLFFAPNEGAFNGEFWNVSSDPELLANVLSYHVLPGNFDTTQNYPNTTIGRTLLGQSSGLTFLEGNRNQALAWSNTDGDTRILNQNTEVKVVGQGNFDKLTIRVIDAIIDLPGPFSWAVDANNLYSFQDALQNAGLYDTLNSMRGVTIFAPTDDAFNSVQQNLDSLSNNYAEMSAILNNHYIAGDSVYTGNFQGGMRPYSAGGEQYSSSFNQNGQYITMGNVTARIVTPDIILENGVLHVIDHVFLNDQVNQGAASSFASSASSAATASTTMTGPIGYTPTSSNGSSSAANGRIEIPLRAFGLSALLGALGVVAGTMLVL